VELMRRAAAKPNVSFSLVMEMALLKLPHMGQQVFSLCRPVWRHDGVLAVDANP